MLITRQCCNLSAIIENPPMLTTLRQEMASPRAWRPTAQSSKSMENRSEFFLAPSIISGFHLDIFTSDYPSHRVHPQYWQTRLRQYRVRPCNFKNTTNSSNTLNTLGPVELKEQAAGLNTIDVYVPWNLHEPRRGEFDFGRQVSHLSLENLQSS